MSDLPVSQDDVNRLADKLDELGGNLTDTERALLLGVFGLASNALGGAVEDSSKPADDEPVHYLAVSGDLPALSDAFKSTFQPGRAGEFVFEEGAPGLEARAVSVGGTCVTWTD